MTCASSLLSNGWIIVVRLGLWEPEVKSDVRDLLSPAAHGAKRESARICSDGQDKRQTWTHTQNYWYMDVWIYEVRVRNVSSLRPSRKQQKIKQLKIVAWYLNVTTETLQPFFRYLSFCRVWRVGLGGRPWLYHYRMFRVTSSLHPADSSSAQINCA